MAKSATTWEGRRALTDNPATRPATYQSAAEELVKLGQLAEAAVFFGLAGDDQSLNTIIDQAVEEGNLFLFKEAFSRLHDTFPPRDRLRALKEAAERNGRFRYAEQTAAWLEA